jgi:outer membrane receptor for ferrienterochelin and colicins
MPAQLTLGGEHVYNNLKDRMLGYNRKIDQKINIESLFVQNEWKNEKLSILLGSRLDRHNLIKNKPIFSPRVNLRYSPSGLISVRASYSAGFRAPQTYDEDLHVAAVGGEVFLISVDPNLKTEKSQTYTASFDLYRAFGKLETNVLIEGFYTNLDNVFVLEEIGNDAQGNLLLERRNGAGAVVKGINLEGKLAPSNKFQAQLGFTVQKSEYVEPLVWSTNENLSPQKRMFRSPSTYGYLTAFYKPIKELNVSLSGTYTGSMLVQHLEGYISEDMEFETPEFFDLNIKIAYDFKINLSGSLQLNAGVKNIFNAYQKDFDQGEFRDAGYIYGPGLPRTYFAGLKIMI